MRYLLVSVLAFSVIGVFGLMAQQPKPPDKLVFTTKMGNVTYNHAAHVTRVKGDCKVCHEKLFKQSSKAPLEFKAGMHKPAEAAKTSCGACHPAGGTAFETKGNCAKCHVKAS